jgi:hypothetical protein
MKRFKINIYILAAILSCLVMALPTFAYAQLASKPSQVANPPLNVNVTNTPLPVTGNVTGTVTGAVQVTNDETKPVPIRSVSKPEVLFGQKGFEVGTPSVRINLFTVPAGKCLIIEYVAASSSGIGNLNVNTLMIFANNHPIPIDNFQTGAGTVPEHFVSKLVHIFAMPETDVEGFATIYPYDEGGNVQFFIHGHLVDVE